MKQVMNFLLISCLFLSSNAFAQENERLNVIKTNLPSIIVKNYNLQYERKLNGHWAAAASVRWMPESRLPFKKVLRNSINTNNAGASEFLDNARISNIAITPEVIYYFNGKGSGFYGSMFYRYTRFGTSELQVTIDASKLQDTISLKGDIHAHSLGLQLGWQKQMGRNFLLDVWILGPQYGVSSGLISGSTSRILNKDEQQLLRQNLEEYSIKYFQERIEVYDKGAGIHLKGPWAGVRTGISIGFRF